MQVWLFPLTHRFKKFELLKSDLIPKSYFYKGQILSQSIVEVVLDYLVETGWIESKIHNTSYYKGEYFPWITFSATDFLERLNLEKLSVVEFGAGASTCYFSERANNVKSFEFDAKYFSQISSITTKYLNLEIINYNELNLTRWIEDQKSNITTLDEKLSLCIEWDKNFHEISLWKDAGNELFQKASKYLSSGDIIFIDGGPRNTALFLAARHSSENSIVIVDNSDREDISLGIGILTEVGFHEIAFSGLGPLNHYKSQTSFFVKNLDTLKVKTKDDDQLKRFSRMIK